MIFRCTVGKSFRRCWSITALPVHQVLKRPTGQIFGEIFAEQVDALVLRDITHGRDMRRDEDALVIPQAPVRRALEFALIDVQRNTPEFALSKRTEQRFFVDNLTAGNVDQNGTRPQSGKSVAADQMGGLFRPWTRNCYEIGLPQQLN